MQASCHPEEEAIRRARKGESDRLSVLYTKYRDLVYRRCLRLTRDVASAEDLTQEVFLTLCNKLSSFKGRAAFKTWLYRVVTNIVLTHFRRNKNQALQLPLQQPHCLGDHEISLGCRLRSKPPQLDDQVFLSEAFSMLPPGSREVLMLHDVEGYKHTEIARMLGIHDGTSRSQLHLARVNLRALFDGSRSKGGGPASHEESGLSAGRLASRGAA